MSWNGLTYLLGKSLTYYIGIGKEGKAASKHTLTNVSDERRTAEGTVSMYIMYVCMSVKADRKSQKSTRKRPKPRPPYLGKIGFCNRWLDVKWVYYPKYPHFQQLFSGNTTTGFGDIL
jgi:hypothetical protein